MSTKAASLLSAFLVLIGLALAPAARAADGFDVVLLVDDSSSMGTSTLGGERSDKEGRRIRVLNMLLKGFYLRSLNAHSVLKEERDFRLSVVRFGSDAVVSRQWETISRHREAGLLLPSAEDRVWTDFPKAFAQAKNQLDKLRAITPAGEKRIPVVILLTDGEPSTRERPEKLAEDDEFWKGLRRQFFEPVRAAFPDTKFFVVAFSNPASGDYWPKVQAHWTDLGAENTVIRPGLNERQLYLQIENDILDRIYKLPTRGPDANGRFTVPCYQSQLDFQLYLHGAPRPVTLRDPSGTELPDLKQAGYATDGTTYTRFTVSEPRPGQWLVTDFRPEDYTLRFTPLPFDVTYSEPPGKMFLQQPSRLAFDLVAGRANKAPLPRCDAKGRVEISEGPPGNGVKTQTLPLAITYTDSGFKAVTRDQYTPPARAGAVWVKIVVTDANDETIVALEAPAVPFLVSNAKLAWVDTGDTVLTANDDTAAASLRMAFRLSTPDGPLAKLDSVFTTPDSAVRAVLTCPTGDCAPRTTVGKQLQIQRVANADDGSIRYAVDLIRVDPEHLGADVTLTSPPTGSRLGRQLRLLKGEQPRLKLEWEGRPQAAPGPDVRIVGKRGH